LGLYTAVSKILQTLNNIDVMRIPNLNVPGQWVPTINAIQLRDPVTTGSIDTITHESAHAYLDRGNFGFDLNRHEGFAIAVEQLVTTVMFQVDLMEKRFRRGGCEEAQFGNDFGWPGFWDMWGDPASGLWIGVRGYEKKGVPARDFDVQDFVSIKNHWGIHLSCQTMADYINRNYLDTCCFEVTCDATGGPYQIAAGVEIAPVFR